MNFVARRNTKRKTSLLFILKLFVGLALLAWLFTWHDNGVKILEIFANIRVDYLILLFLMVFGLNLVSCLKWQLFLKEYGYNVSVLRLLSLYCIGKFFNNFFPSTVGGDVARSYILGKQIRSQGQSFASVLLERLTGFLALIILAFAFAAMNIQLLKEPIIAISFIVIGITIAFPIILLLFPHLLNAFAELLSNITMFNKLLTKIKLLWREIFFFREKPVLLLKSMGYSFLFHCMTIIQVYLACLAINFTPHFLDVALITPIVLMITSLPLSPNKLGIWEWAFGVFLLQAGGEMVEGVAVALIIRGLGLTVSVIGGILLITEKINNRDQSIHNYKP